MGATDSSTNGLFEYNLVPGPARTELERHLDNTDESMDAFARWMTEAREVQGAVQRGRIGMRSLTCTSVLDPMR